ncbi:glycosyltransferase family 4 protein [Stappia indica]|uniref:Glycosyltransferase involved in cell wall bisynthesis n=1 Tax=Stappia indica TaxID=538381 RepID=A0A285TGA8_9HYPH|nr:glycosyltransferase family 4 protein [Stappia indica]SOC19599.1 Glycosyltransferase involved in cell wall bisynthesis [Stappia indica]
MTAAARLTFLYPGRLETPTGGYVYDRELLAALAAIGVEATALTLGEGYPAPSPATLKAGERLLAGLADGEAVMIDGLAFGVMDAIAAPHAQRLRLIALVHHPLAHESGVPADRAAELHDSERRALALARHVVTTSPATAAAVIAEFGVASEQVSVLEPGLVLPPVRTRRARQAGDPFRLLCVGSLVPRKDHPTLLTALAGLCDTRITVDIAGSAELDPAHASRVRAEIDRLDLASQVRLHGALPKEALDALYAEADAFALTTLYEGYGMAFVEAMAHGLPVIATGAGAVRDTVPGAAGILCEAGDAAAIGSAIRQLADDPRRTETMAQAARAHAQSLPGWQDQARRLAALIAEIAR